MTFFDFLYQFCSDILGFFTRENRMQKHKIIVKKTQDLKAALRMAVEYLHMPASHKEGDAQNLFNFYKEQLIERDKKAGYVKTKIINGFPCYCFLRKEIYEDIDSVWKELLIQERNKKDSLKMLLFLTDQDFIDPYQDNQQSPRHF